MFKNIRLLSAFLALSLASATPVFAQGPFCELLLKLSRLPMQPTYLQERITYLNEEQRIPYELTIGQDGLIYDHNRKLFDTSRAHVIDEVGTYHVTKRAIFVVSMDGHWYASAQQKVREFHHSSFTSGERVLVPGEFSAYNGKLDIISLRSGHYLPDPYRLTVFLQALQKGGASLGGVRIEIAGLGDSISRIAPTVSAADYMVAVTKEVATAQDALAYLSQQVKGAERVRVVVAALFNRPFYAGVAEATYPESYNARIFPALKDLVRDPATRQDMVQLLIEGTNAGAGHHWEITPIQGWYNRRSAELDQTVFDLAQELPDVSLKLMKVLSRRKAVGMITQESPLFGLIPDVVQNESYGY